MIEHMFESLREEILGLLAEMDRLGARLATALASFDEAELWDADGAVSLQSWLQSVGGRTPQVARQLTRTARRTASLPAVADAWAAGALSGGQVDVIIGNLTTRTAG